jgi:hypothetical protein
VPVCRQDDWENWKAITADVSCQIVGDDHVVTNPTRIKKAIEEKSCNALLLKVRVGVVWLGMMGERVVGDGLRRSLSHCCMKLSSVTTAEQTTRDGARERESGQQV